MRGVWIASVANIDWPSRPGLSPEQAQAELVAWYDEAKANGRNQTRCVERRRGEADRRQASFRLAGA